MDHVVLVMGSAEEGYLAHCACGWRDQEWRERAYEAKLAADAHERDAKYLRLNGGGRISLKSLIAHYRANATSPVFDHAERRQWRMLADDLETQIMARRPSRDPIDGQFTLPLD